MEKLWNAKRIGFWIILKYKGLGSVGYIASRSGSNTRQNVDITPREAVRRIGDELTVLCKVPYNIDSCRMTVGTTSYRLIPDNIDGDVIYAGQGLKNGECGALIKNIKEEWNGNISCVLPPPTGSIELTGTMRLMVARAPGEPHLISPPQSSFREGDDFMAQCVVPNGRPAAKITWLLGNQDLLAGVHMPVLTSEPGSDLVTIMQNVSRKLTADDDNTLLVCRAEHEALEKPMEAKRQLVVHYPPTREDPSGSNLITIFGLKLGAEGRLNVTVRANPAPIAEWTVEGVHVQAPNSDHPSFNALAPHFLGNGYYNVTLILSTIEKEDVENTYLLRVSNDLGTELYSVKISTMAEPAGVELSTGAIVGIVIGVLVVLIAAVLVVLAYATDRWCFAGRSHRTDIPDGADSEAPLPPHDDIKGSENPTHDHGDYISNGDTKHPEKKPDTEV
ncbi:unnamed protein product [Arctia plantaginis]|uniref:Ig-like domain-containing protein n=1 Tax=Arctia plantaginis TaxID=874455 RepID=A0A8S1B3L9_ARCPL|nr:unnamed protein product [Arctia plantaginis]CAB3252584.1 unnamed protein product [Arctia plantaginis]